MDSSTAASSLDFPLTFAKYADIARAWAASDALRAAGREEGKDSDVGQVSAAPRGEKRPHPGDAKHVWHGFRPHLVARGALNIRHLYVLERWAWFHPGDAPEVTEKRRYYLIPPGHGRGYDLANPDVLAHGGVLREGQRSYKVYVDDHGVTVMLQKKVLHDRQVTASNCGMQEQNSGGRCTDSGVAR